MHYVCTGSCGAESNEPKVCESEFCSKEGKELVPCNCTDGSHDMAGKPKEPEDPDLT